MAVFDKFRPIIMKTFFILNSLKLEGLQKKQDLCKIPLIERANYEDYFDYFGQNWSQWKMKQQSAYADRGEKLSHPSLSCFCSGPRSPKMTATAAQCMLVFFAQSFNICTWNMGLGAPTAACMQILEKYRLSYFFYTFFLVQLVINAPYTRFF